MNANLPSSLIPPLFIMCDPVTDSGQNFWRHVAGNANALQEKTLNDHIIDSDGLWRKEGANKKETKTKERQERKESKKKKKKKEI